MLATLHLDRRLPTPLHRQLYAGMRELIMAGDLEPGTRLPSTRAVAQELDVSRNTVVTAFEQLGAEGYIELEVGVGTHVCDVGQSAPGSQPLVPGTDRLGERGRLLARPLRQVPVADAPAFTTGIPALDAFPRTTWARLLNRRSRDADPGLMGYGHPGGYIRLREVLCTYLRSSRGVRCSPDDVIVMTSAQAGIDLASRLVLDRGDTALMEDPGYPGARAALEGNGLNVVPVPVDSDGFDIDTAASMKASLVCVTPSHQFPTGVTMSVPRRLALLEWAHKNDTWIIEDDYDSEFHYGVRPIPSLQGLAESRHVIYLGTFAKTLLPALRIAYAVVPPDLADAFRQAIRHTGQEPSLMTQAALADFIDEGHFARHLRRMRRLYGARRALLVDTLAAGLGDKLKISSTAGGLQICIELPANIDDIALSGTIADAGISVLPLSIFSMTQVHRPGLIAGFAATPEAAITTAAQRLVELLVKRL